MLSPATTTATLAPNVMDSRYLIGSAAQRVISYPVTQAPHRLQRGPVEGTVDLVAERADVDVDDPGMAAEGKVPDVRDQRSPGEHIARPAHEVLQQRELGRVRSIRLPSRATSWRAGSSARSPRVSTAGRAAAGRRISARSRARSSS